MDEEFRNENCLKGEAEMTYNKKTGKEKMIRIWIIIIRHRGLGHLVQE